MTHLLAVSGRLNSIPARKLDLVRFGGIAGPRHSAKAPCEALARRRGLRRMPVGEFISRFGEASSCRCSLAPFRRWIHIRGFLNITGSDSSSERAETMASEASRAQRAQKNNIRAKRDINLRRLPNVVR